MVRRVGAASLDRFQNSEGKENDRADKRKHSMYRDAKNPEWH